MEELQKRDEIDDIDLPAENWEKWRGRNLERRRKIVRCRKNEMGVLCAGQDDSDPGLCQLASPMETRLYGVSMTERA